MKVKATAAAVVLIAAIVFAGCRLAPSAEDAVLAAATRTIFATMDATARAAEPVVCDSRPPAPSPRHAVRVSSACPETSSHTVRG